MPNSDDEEVEPLETEPLLLLFDGDSSASKPSSAPPKPDTPPASSLLRRIAGSLYGEDALQAHGADAPRVAWLAMMLGCIIGSFWLLDSLKDTVFATLVGLEHQPKAKVCGLHSCG